MSGQLGKRGVETEATLGKRAVRPTVADMAPVISQESVEQALEDLSVIRDRLETSVAQAWKAMSDAQVLYAGLKVLATAIREQETTDREADLVVPEHVEQALMLLVTLQEYDAEAAPPEGVDAPQVLEAACPECAQGKHPNCTVQIMLPDDTESVCACHVAGHPL